MAKWQALKLDYPSTLRVAAISEDGSAIVAASTDGKVGWFDRDLKKRWERALKSKPTAVAIDPLAQVTAVATKNGQLVLFHADGEPARETTCPRPARHLEFVPGTATLLAAADLGWVAAFDLETGEWLWRDMPVVEIGSLAVAGAAEPILLACFSAGLRGYHRDGKPWAFPTPVPSCRAAAVSYDAALVVMLQIDGMISGWSLPRRSSGASGIVPKRRSPAMCLAALGETLYLALADRRVAALALS